MLNGTHAHLALSVYYRQAMGQPKCTHEWCLYYLRWYLYNQKWTRTRRFMAVYIIDKLKGNKYQVQSSAICVCLPSNCSWP
jgi:hypothetical protein